MFTNATPLFPQGVVGTYHHENYVLDPSLISHFETTKAGEGIQSTQLKKEAFENILDEEVLTPIRDFIVESLRHYLQEVAAMPYEEFWFTSSWLNFTTTDGHQNYHNHTNSIISGVYYVYSDEKDPGLTFRKEHRSHKPYITLYTNTANMIHADHAEVPTKTGDLIIFPSHMIHGYGASQSPNTRISLAWNILLNQPEHLAPQGWYHIKFAK